MEIGRYFCLFSFLSVPTKLNSYLLAGRMIDILHTSAFFYNTYRFCQMTIGILPRKMERLEEYFAEKIYQKYLIKRLIELQLSLSF